MKLKFYWQYKPSKLQGLSLRQRKAAARYVRRRTFRHWQVWPGVTLRMLCSIGLGAAFGLLMAFYPFPDGWATAELIIQGRKSGWLAGGMYIGGLVGTLLCVRLINHYARPYVKAYLASIGHCQSCGYDLRGAPSGVCPECGSVAPEQPTKPSEKPQDAD